MYLLRTNNWMKWEMLGITAEKTVNCVYLIITISWKTIQTCLAFLILSVKHRLTHAIPQQFNNHLWQINQKKNLHQESHEWIKCTLSSLGMANQPPAAKVSHSSLFFCFFCKFNLKWMGCGLKRRIEKAEHPGGEAAYWFPSCCSIWALLKMKPCNCDI